MSIVAPTGMFCVPRFPSFLRLSFALLALGLSTSASQNVMELAMRLGAVLGTPREHNAWWFPSSVVPRDDGSVGIFPHIIMRGFPEDRRARVRVARSARMQMSSDHPFARSHP